MTIILSDTAVATIVLGLLIAAGHYRAAIDALKKLFPGR